jgi:pescadillo protein
MLTFLELYQTLLGFVFFKLYADAGLVYPPPLDAKKDEGAAGMNAFSLQEEQKNTVQDIPKARAVDVAGKKVSGKDVRQAIKAVATTSQDVPAPDADMAEEAGTQAAEVDEDFVVQPSKADVDQAASLHTLQTISELPQAKPTTLFAPCVFWLSRETSRPIFEFIVRSFGGRIGWPASSGGGSPFDETDPSITHVIIDRPVVERADETAEERELRRQRKYVQPQWVADSINAGRLLVEEPYLQGATLPPHLSPFGAADGAYDPTAPTEDVEMSEAEDEEAEDAEDAEAGEQGPSSSAQIAQAVQAAISADDPAALRVAELEAEAAGVDFSTFEKQVSKTVKKRKAAAPTPAPTREDNPNKMLMSNKQRKLYERMKHSQNKQSTEVCLRWYDRQQCKLTEPCLTCSAKRSNSGRYRSRKRSASRPRPDHLRLVFGLLVRVFLSGCSSTVPIMHVMHPCCMLSGCDHRFLDGRWWRRHKWRHCGLQ